MEKAYKNVVYLFVGLFVLVLFGFYKPYLGEFPDFDKSITVIVHIHATALIIWVVLLVVQPILIRLKKRPLHRRIGKFTYFLVPVIIVTSIAVMSKQYHEYVAHKMTSAQSLKALLIPFAEILFFSVFYLLAIIHKRRVPVHMRYIIGTALVLITPSLARVMGYWFDTRQSYSYDISFILSDLLLIALIIFDKQRNLNFKPYTVVLTLFLIFHISWYLMGQPF